MKFSENKILFFRISLVLVIVLCINLLSDRLDTYTNNSFIKVEESGKSLRYSEPDSLRPLIKYFSQTTRVVSQPYLSVKDNRFLEFFVPDMVMGDPIYIILFITVCIIFLLKVKSFIDEKPFTTQMVQGVKWAGITCLVFATFDFLRMFLINRYVLNVTNHSYKLERFSLFPPGLYCAGFIILLFNKIFKKAETIQSEQELTV